MPRFRVKPFQSEHLDAAAALLAARHARDRVREPVLPEVYAHPDAVRPLLEQLLVRPATSGAVALSDERLIGFALGETVLTPPTASFAVYIRPRAARVTYAAHAVESGAEDVYRDLYAALAAGWVARGYFAHYVEVAAGDRTARDAWFSLGFGDDIAAAVRDTGPVAPDRLPGRVSAEFTAAAGEDIDAVMELALGLTRHHAQPPMCFPYLPETEPDARRFQQDLLANPANAHWLASEIGHAVALQTFLPGGFLSPLVTPERSVYLFQGYTRPEARGSGVGTALLDHSMAWARGQGFEHCTLHYLTANLSGSRFWTGHGFRPVDVRMFREVDQRIAWAHGRE